jgi:hypothetical protein
MNFATTLVPVDIFGDHICRFLFLSEATDVPTKTTLAKDQSGHFNFHTENSNNLNGI